MKIVLRPGHGLTPPGPLAYARYTRSNRNLPDGAFPWWSLQRPGSKEDNLVGLFCGEHLIPALVAAGHCVAPQRALDPVYGTPDRTIITIGPEIFPQLTEGQSWTGERWRVNAAVEAVLRGVARPEWRRGLGWSHDPVISCWAERQAPGDAYLSVHRNWWTNPRMYGCVVLFCRGSRRGEALARAVYDAIVSEFRGGEWAAGALHPWGSPERDQYIAQGSRWICRSSHLYELRRTKAPAVLVELGFASNPGDVALMADPQWQARMARAIARGIED
jgi:hypothetical protein